MGVGHIFLCPFIGFVGTEIVDLHYPLGVSRCKINSALSRSIFVAKSFFCKKSKIKCFLGVKFLRTRNQNRIFKSQRHTVSHLQHMEIYSWPTCWNDQVKLKHFSLNSKCLMLCFHVLSAVCQVLYSLYYASFSGAPPLKCRAGSGVNLSFLPLVSLGDVAPALSASCNNLLKSSLKCL